MNLMSHAMLMTVLIAAVSSSIMHIIRAVPASEASIYPQSRDVFLPMPFLWSVFLHAPCCIACCAHLHLHRRGWSKLQGRNMLQMGDMTKPFCRAVHAVCILLKQNVFGSYFYQHLWWLKMEVFFHFSNLCQQKSAAFLTLVPGIQRV